MGFFDTTALSRVLIATVIALASTGTAAAQASDQTPPPPATQAPVQADDVNNIVVTAQKREERVQDVPVAVQVLSGASLEARGIRDFTDLTRATPSLIIRPAEHPVNASISVRGIGTFAFSPSVEPSVAVQIDDVPVQFLARAFADLSDIERIELLRGPQSTLYGRSASAGLLNIVTQGPTASLSGRIQGLVTTDEEYQIQGSLAGPITSHLGFRVSANYNDYKGNVKNLFTGDTINGRRIFSGRAKLVWDPTDNLNITGQFSYVDGHTTIGRPWIRVSPDARLRGNAAYGPSVFAPGVTFGEDNNDVVNNITSGTDYSDYAESLKASLDLGFATAMSITAWDQFRQFDILDQDESAIAALDNQQFGTFGTHAFSQEFRLVSPGTQRLRYTLGLFYSNLQITRDFTRGPFFSIAHWYATNGNKQYAAFGQLEFDLLRNTTLIAGMRAGWGDIDYTFLDYAANNARFAGADSESYQTYRAGLQQKITPDVMAFFTYATGHKGQAYDIGTGFNKTRQDSGPVRPETSEDWEVGLKTQFAGHHVTLNVTLFTTSFDNFQAQGIQALADGTINFRLANVGRLRTRGVEIEGGVHYGEFSLNGGVTYNDAVIRSFPLAQCWPGQTVPPTCVNGTGPGNVPPGKPTYQDLAGFRPAQAPEWKFTLGAEYTPELTDGLDGVFRADYTYQSKFNFGINNDPETIQPGYGIMNLSAGVRGHGGSKWEVSAFLNNAFDKQYFYNLANSFGNQGGKEAVQSYLPRDFRRYGGIRASIGF